MTKTVNPKPYLTLQELHHDAEQAFKNDSLSMTLNFPPPDEWIKPHPTAKVKNDQNQTVSARYLPIDKVEFLLTRIFQRWSVEVLREGYMFNSVYVTVRLHLINPVDGKPFYVDGVGAKDLQLDASTDHSPVKPSDLHRIKAAAVMMALPTAKSYAIKDAAEHLGPLFGRDLNRRNIIPFVGSYIMNDETPAQTMQQNNYQPGASLNEVGQNVLNAVNQFMQMPPQQTTPYQQPQPVETHNQSPQIQM